jgi:hypothetical protein
VIRDFTAAESMRSRRSRFTQGPTVPPRDPGTTTGKALGRPYISSDPPRPAVPGWEAELAATCRPACVARAR